MFKRFKTDFTPLDCFFQLLKLTKKADKEKHGYSMDETF